MVRRNKTTEKRLRHNCPTCQASYTLLETHLTKKDLANCPTNCQKTWQAIIHKYCQEKVLGAELEQEQERDENLKQTIREINKDHGSN